MHRHGRLRGIRRVRGCAVHDEDVVSSQIVSDMRREVVASSGLCVVTGTFAENTWQGLYLQCVLWSWSVLV